LSDGPYGTVDLCLALASKSRMEGRSKLAIGGKEAHDVGDRDPIYRSKG